MILTIRKKTRFIVAFLLFTFAQTYSTEVYALTSGPAQEEYASFEPIGTTDMVNLYTGDFTYNIPLLSVPGPNGGYPINLAYHSGVGMDQEASWVGLGWNVNVGAVNRGLRGLPDDFNGDEVTHKQHIRESWTVGLNLFQRSLETLGFEGMAEGSFASPTLQIYYNNYKGLGYRVRYSPTPTSGAVSLGVNLSYDPHEGVGVGASLTINGKFGENVSGSLGVSGNWTSRQGFQGVSLSGSAGGSFTQMIEKNHFYAPSNSVGDITKKNSFSRGAGGVTFNFNHGVPGVTMPMESNLFTTDLKLGFSPNNFPIFGQFQSNFPLNWSGMASYSKTRGDGVSTSRAYGYMNTENGDRGNDLLDYSPASINYTRKLPYISPSNITNDVFSITGQGISGVFRGYRSDIGVFSQKNITNLTPQGRVSIDVGVTTPLNIVSCGPVTYHLGFGSIPNLIGIAKSTSGDWSGGKGVANDLNFLNRPSHEEGKYFKDVGDRPAIFKNKTNTDASMYDAWGGDDPARLEISGQSFTTGVEVTGISAGDGANRVLLDVNKINFKKKTERSPRSRVIQTLTREETKKYGISKSYTYYDNTGELTNNKYATYHKEDHISEVSILEPDGMRYIYGLPAYNIMQEDAAFSVAKDAVAQVYSKSTTTMPAGEYDSPIGDWSKKPEFLDKKNLPSYAHSWMLTAAVSADYVDITGDGISSDDLGYWVDFRYKKTTDAYHWRAPYEGASYMPGNNQDFDDKGSYSAGKKELFYLKEIRTKTHIAIYEIEEREDALGVDPSLHNGGAPIGSNLTDADKMQLLRKIKLYTIDEYQKQLDDVNYMAEPLKTTHFVYKHDDPSTINEELCKGVPNHTTPNNKVTKSRGKLTLHQVYFTFGKSNKGALSPYEFDYSSNNPNYSQVNFDCWGNYQDNTANLGTYAYNVFPYTNQTIDPAYKAPWHLTSVNLPTGGVLNVEYEQDDYAYVEDKKAMQLYDIFFTGDGDGFANIAPTAHSERGTAATQAHLSSLRNIDHHNTSPNGSPDFEYRIYFALKNSIPDLTNPTRHDFYQGYGASSAGLIAWFKENYIGETQDLYFKAAVNLLDEDNISRGDERVDYVGGYAKLRAETPFSHYGVVNSGKPGVPTNVFDVGYITVSPVAIKAFGVAEDDLHPIRNAALQHLKHNRSELVYGTKSARGVAGLFSAIPDIMDALAGYKYAYKLRNYADEIFLDGFSQIRLLTPNGRKIGGGVRVKKVTVKDNWESMTQDGGSSNYKDATYGQVYNYSIEEEGKLISSGVAYEPFAGKEQNPMVAPAHYKHSTPIQGLFGGHNNLFIEKPVMFTHYPSASVGYRKVTVKSITTANSTENRSTTPFTEYEFYSPKEFPIEFKETYLDKTGPNYNIIPIPGIYTKFERYEGASQGYSLIYNDMAGKPKSITQKTQPKDNLSPMTDYEGTVISKQEFEYFTDDDGNLLNEVDVFTEDGTYEKAKLGVDYDIQVEMNENKESSSNFALDFNLDGNVITTSIPGICIPMPMLVSGGISFTSSSLKTAVVQKIIKKRGIQKSTTVTTQNASIKTENLAFDALTGDVLLTRTSNEFKDNIYAYNQKAHWHYEGMGAAFKNVGMCLEGSFFPGQPSGTTNDVYYIPDNYNLAEFPFTEGDEVFIEGIKNGTQGFTKAFVYTTSHIGNSKDGLIGLVYHNGNLVDYQSINKITIIRSGRKNLLSASVGNIVAMLDDNQYQPSSGIGNPKNLVFDGNSKILAASAVKYRDYWPSSKNCELDDFCAGNYCINPITGVDENNFLTKVTNNEIIVELDGTPLASSDILVIGACSNQTTQPVSLCTKTTDPGYTVEVTNSQGTNVVTSSILPNSNCSISQTSGNGEATFPCTPLLQKSKINAGTDIVLVDGVVHPISNVIRTGSCRYARGFFALTCLDPSGMPTGRGSRPRVTLTRCLHGNINVQKIKSYFYWNLTPTYVNSSLPTNGIINSMGDLANILNTQTGKNWFIDATNHLAAYMPVSEADDLINGQAKMGLEGFRLTGFLGLVWRPQFGCYPCVDGGGNSAVTLVWHDFKYVTEDFDKLKITGLSPGPHSIYYFSGGVPIITINPNISSTTTTVPVDQVQVQLPIGETSVVKVYDSQGNLVNSVSYTINSATSTGVELAFPLKGLGSHELKIIDNSDINNPILLETTSLTCSGQDATQALACEDAFIHASFLGQPSLVPIAANNNNKYNFYSSGTKGNWRTWAAYTYVTDRYYGDGTNQDPNLREKGVFKEFTPFSWIGTNVKQWQKGGLSTKYDPHGYELETVNAIGHYNAALYDYNNNLAVAVAKNARYNEILFDGFENYPKECSEGHWTVINADKVTDEDSHTGVSSYKIDANSFEFFDPINLGGIAEEECASALSANYSEADVLAFLQHGIETSTSDIPKLFRTTTTGLVTDFVDELPEACDCLGKFAPEQGDKYYISAWMKRNSSMYNYIKYNELLFYVRFRDAGGAKIGSSDVLIPIKGSMVERWQRISGEVTIPNNATTMEFLVSNWGDELYLDDLRMQPADAAMITYVYDKKSLRKTAQLDDNNFATFYIYDEAGQLVKTKKETTEGIKTITEGRQHIKRK
jgi:hypothetical protein